MSAEFIKMVSEIYNQQFNVHLGELLENRTPCGIFFSFEIVPSHAATYVQVLINEGLNITCAIVLADVQVNMFRKFVSVPVITIEDFSRFGEENFPVKPQEVFVMYLLKDFAFAPYFERHNMEVITPYIDDRFSYTMNHLPQLYSVYEMLGSDESKKVFCAAIKGDLTGKMGDYRFAPEPQYFLEGFTPSAGDIAIDGGDYDGGTALAFSRCGAKVYAFEMDANNYRNCAARLGNNSHITLENLGLSNKAGEEKYFSVGVGSRRDLNGALIGKFIDLDTYVEQKNLPRVDYIKLDIEGAELDMLHGAAKTITHCKPKMAVSAYHKPEDLWTLATYIKSLRADYEFEFRHYRIDCSDYILDDEERAILRYFGLDYLVPTSSEKVLYCR